MSILFLGIKGSVIALDRKTGSRLWSAKLKGSDFVNVVFDTDQVLATTQGEIFCLDPATGDLLWHNKLRGEGRGLVTIATPATSSNSMPPLQLKRTQKEAESRMAGG